MSLVSALLLGAPAMATDLHAQVSASLMRPEQRSLRPMQWTPPPKLVPPSISTEPDPVELRFRVPALTKKLVAVLLPSK